MRAFRFGFLAFLMSTSALAQPAPNGVAVLPEMAQCRGGPSITPDAQLAGCNSAITTMEPARGNAEPYAIRCALKLDKDDISGAIADCTKAIEIDPKNADAIHSRAVAYMENNDINHAIADCDALLKLDPQSAGALTLRGINWSRKGDYAHAIGDFEQALKLRPGYGMAQSGLDQAKAAQQQVAQGQKPGDMRAWCDGNALPQEGFAGDLQIKGCTALIQSGGEKSEDLARDYFNRGSAYDFAGEDAKAVTDFDQAIMLNPNDAEAYYRRGAVKLQGGKYELAISDLNKSIDLDSSHAESFLDRGSALAAMAQFDGAIADFEYALKLQPNDPEAYLALCRAHTGKHSYTQAVASCSSAIQYSRTTEATQGYASRGDAHLLAGDYAAAIADYDEALNRGPDYPAAFFGRGVAKLKKGDAAGGKDDIEAARKLKPDIDADEASIGIKP